MFPFLQVTTMPIEITPMATDAAVGLGIFAGAMSIFYLIFGLGSYIWLAICLYKIAQKQNAENPWFAWIPILNLVLMLEIAKKPMWWIVMFLIPIANIVFAIMLYVEFLKVLGKPTWWVVLMILVPFAYHVIFGILAFGKEKSAPAQAN